MSKLIFVILSVIVAAATADPLLLSAPLIASPYTSAAYFSPASASVVAAPVASVSPVSAAVPAAVPFSSVSAYSYGSSYSIQDYLPATAVVNPPASLAYSLPYAYAADYFYRR